MPATAPLRHPKECRRRKCNNGEIPHATLRNSICIFEEKVLAKNNVRAVILWNTQSFRSTVKLQTSPGREGQLPRMLLIICYVGLEMEKQDDNKGRIAPYA